MQLDVKLEYPNLSHGKKQENHLLVRMRSPSNPKLQKRKPLLVGLAIDKSWSMKGEKMEAVVEAASSLVGWLTRHDALSVVAYSSDVQMIQPLTHLTEKLTIIDKLRNIQVATSTNLSGGYLSSLKTLHTGQVPDSFKRVLLLTDGNPTSGIRDKEALVQIAKDHLKRGISTTTIGVGNDFNEDILVEIAKAGGGNFYYIDNPEKASDIFFQEFGDLGALYAQAIDLEVSFAPGIKIKQILGGNEDSILEEFDEFVGSTQEVVQQKCQIPVGDMRLDDSRSLLFHVEIDNIEPINPFCKINLSFYNLFEQSKLETIDFSFVPEFGEFQSKQDIDVLVELLIANASRGIKEITNCIRQKLFEEAKTLLVGLIHDIKINKKYAPNALGSILNRLLVLDAKLQESSVDLNKHLMFNAQILEKGPEKIDSKDTEYHNDVFTYNAEGDIDLYRCPEIKHYVESKLQEGFRYGILDFSATSHIDSSAIGTMIQIVGWLRKRGGELVVIGLRDSVKKVFEITRLYNHIRVNETKAEAKETLNRLAFAKSGDEQN